MSCNSITNVLLYRMKGNLSTDPTFPIVTWFSQGSPDFTGANSGYPVGNVINIVIDGQPTNLVSSVQFNNPSGPATGDLSGCYPSPTVVGLQTIPVVAGTPVPGALLEYGPNGWSGQTVAGISPPFPLTPLTTPPVSPIFGDNYFGMFVWHFASNSTDDILFSDGYMQSLINFCGTKGVNIIFLGVEPYLSPQYYTLQHEQSLNKFIHYLHLSGIEVHALMGQGSNGDGYARNPGTGPNFIGYGQAQNWYVKNIVAPIQQYNQRAGSNLFYPNGKFDGFCLDSEYYDNGPSFYNTVEAEGNIEINNITKAMLPGLKTGITVSWTTMPALNAYTYRGGDGYYGTEGCHMINAPGVDYIIVQAYRNTFADQQPLFDPFFQATNNTSKTYSKIRTNIPLFLASSCESEITPSHTYYTGAPGAYNTMITQLTLASRNYNPQPENNSKSIFQGHVIEEYWDSFNTMQ